MSCRATTINIPTSRVVPACAPVALPDLGHNEWGNNFTIGHANFNSPSQLSSRWSLHCPLLDLPITGLQGFAASRDSAVLVWCGEMYL